MASRSGIILFAHGSRDPLWRAPIEAVQSQIERQHPGAQVRCAYLELCAPDLYQATQSLHAAGVRRISIVPMFLGTGRHAREDLPGLVTQLRQMHPDLEIAVQQAIGEDARMTALMAQIAIGSGAGR
ncbi:MAG: CbiX/SirB N-terminal domain-containing protein [Burkholderiaceae bacterium]|jgi:sirohydrochlorin cobaltochelatase|nr:CbiX/SirB N-terminal domain-containing protein [Burkholderiaceae bacterium]MCO5104441.1 CbiX/SirB N-terminal domain-containing protein [Burkholderiaceae bacterium]